MEAPTRSMLPLSETRERLPSKPCTGSLKPFTQKGQISLLETLSLVKENHMATSIIPLYEGTSKMGDRGHISRHRRTEEKAES